MRLTSRRGLLKGIGAGLSGGLALRGATSGSPPNLGIFLRCTGKTDPREALEAVRSLGLRMVQVSKLPDRFYTPEGAREFAGLLKSTGIRASAVVAVYDGEVYGDIPTIRRTVGFRDPETMPARVVYTKKCVDFARALGVKIVTFHAGFIPSDVNDSAYKRMLQATSEVSRYAAQHGVGISLETGQESAEDLARFIDQVQGAKPHVNFDFANLVLYGKDQSLPALRKLYPRVTSVHVKDGLLPAAPTKLGLETRLGEGKANVKGCLEFLKASHFTGPMVIENYVARRYKTDPMDELRRAKAFVDQVWASTIRNS